MRPTPDTDSTKKGRAVLMARVFHTLFEIFMQFHENIFKEDA